MGRGFLLPCIHYLFASAIVHIASHSEMTGFPLYLHKHFPVVSATNFNALESGVSLAILTLNYEGSRGVVTYSVGRA